MTLLPAVEPSHAPGSSEQPRVECVTRLDRTRDRLLLFAATAFLAVAVDYRLTAGSAAISACANAPLAPDIDCEPLGAFSFTRGQDE